MGASESLLLICLFRKMASNCKHELFYIEWESYRCFTVVIILFFLCSYTQDIFHYVDSPGHVQPSPYLSYGFPKEYIELASGTDTAKLVEALKMVSRLCKYNSDVLFPSLQDTIIFIFICG